MTTWKELAALDPHLVTLETACREWSEKALKKRESCSNAYWYGTIKPEVVKRVGYAVLDKSSPLSTEESYDTAYDHLADLLPPCRHEGVCWWGEGL